MKVEVFDSTGSRYTVTFEGNVTREKAVRLLDIIELLGGMPGVNPNETQLVSELSKLEKTHLIVEKHFPIIWFSSRDVQTVYEQELKEPVALSVVSTYLSRMSGRGILVKTTVGSSKRYRLASQRMQAAAAESFTKDNSQTSTLRRN